MGMLSLALGRVGRGRWMSVGLRGWWIGLTVGVALVIWAAPAWAAGAHMAYVATTDESTVTPIDTTTSMAGTPISVPGSDTFGVAITPDGKALYVSAGEAGSFVTPVDLATNTAGSQITVSSHAASGPGAIAITPDGKTAYVVNEGASTVTPINTATNVAGAEIPVGASPEGIAITPDGKTAYVTSVGSHSVTPIDLATNAAVTPIPVGSDTASIAITPDGKTAYVTTTGTSVVPIDVATNTAGTAISIGGFASSDRFAIAISPDGKTAYVNGPGGVVPIDTATNTAETAITVANGGAGIAISPDGKTVYVTGQNGSGGLVTPIATANNTVGTPIMVGFSPSGVAFTPDQGPTAAFSKTAAPAGQASSFNASASSASNGTVASYHWDFGDGTTQTTTTPTTTHTYAAANTYTVTLTVTDSAGCSNNIVFTGQTASCNASPAAQVTHQVTVVPASPTLSASAPFSGMLGTRIRGSSVLAALSRGAGETGSVTFKVFGPQATPPSDCTTGGTTVGTASVSGDGSYHPPAFTPTQAGDYWWYASYGGDSSNHPAGTACGRWMPMTVVTVSLRLAGHVQVSGRTAYIPLKCLATPPNDCAGAFTLETTSPAGSHNVVMVGEANATLQGGQIKTAVISLNDRGKRLLAERGRLQTRLVITQAGQLVAGKVLTFHPD
jgi:YVTN family beta-propeller protein